ncbi:MAG: IPExxxVDY family protein [Chitinophagaceae bacterium]|nr:MAG: IPExxxVDY family protein [Chitinophagaceae bacterium]
MSSKKIILEFDITLDFEVVGIVSSLFSHELAWLLNKKLNFNFKKANDWHIDIPHTQKIGYFECFYYREDYEWCDIYLLKNFDSNDYLLPELRKFDYLMKIDGVQFSDYSKELIQKLKKLDDLKFVKSFHPEELTSGINLLTNDKDI